MKMDPILRSQPIVAKDGIAVYTAVGNISLPHRHQWLELAYLKQGTLLHTIGDVSYKLQAGNFSLWNTIKSIPMLRWARATGVDAHMLDKFGEGHAHLLLEVLAQVRICVLL